MINIVCLLFGHNFIIDKDYFKEINFWKRSYHQELKCLRCNEKSVGWQFEYKERESCYSTWTKCDLR